MTTDCGPLEAAATWSRWLIAGAVLVAGGQAVGLPSLSSSVTLAIVGVGFLAGLPHGGVDHVVAMRLAGNRSIWQVVAAYAGVAAVAWGLLEWTGPLALVVVVAFSALHFGLGEFEVAREMTGWRPGRLLTAAAVISGSGALILPLARSGEQFTAVAAAVSPGLAEFISAAPLRIGLLATWLLAASVTVVASLLSGHVAIAIDTALIAALGLLVPPLVCFAVWFGGWHALRHSARLLSEEPGCAALLARGRTRDAVRRLAGLAAPPTVAALTAVIALGWFTVSAPDPTAVLAEVLRLLLALTVPHMVVVMWLDRSAADDSRGGVGRPPHHRRAYGTARRHPADPVAG